MVSQHDRLKLDLGYPDPRVFSYEHLPQWLQDISRPFGELARDIWENAPMCQETGVGLRKLLEAKDCIVRAEVILRDDMTEAAVTQGDGIAARSDFAPEDLNC